MTGGLVGGMAAAVAAAVLYGSAPVVQAVAASRTAAGSGVGLSLMLRLARQRMWLLGLAFEIAAFLLEAVAFSAAPATLVAPVMACDTLVFVLLALVVFRTRLSRSGTWGAICMAVGVMLLALAFRGESTLGRPASNAVMIAFLIACVAVSALAAVLGSRALAAHRTTLAAVIFSGASGVAYGFATMATRQIGRTFTADAPLHLLVTPTPYVLAGCSVLAISLMQRGLQTNPVLTFPLTSAVSAFLPVVLGAVFLGDPVPAGATRILFVAALALIATGVTLIGRDRSSAQAVSDRQGEGDPEQEPSRDSGES